MAIFLAGSCSALVACSSRDAAPAGEAPSAEPAASAAPSASVSAAAAPSAAAPVEAPTLRFSVASFLDDELAECVDITVVNPSPGASAEKFVKDKGDGAQLLKRPCGEAFADRASLGQCVAEVKLPNTADAGPSPVLSARTHSYRFQDVFDSDGFMRDCLKLGGDWKAVARDSPEATEARRRLSRRAADKVLETAR